MCAAGGAAGEDAWFEACLRLVAACEMVCHAIYLPRFDKTDRAAAKSAARHPRAKDSTRVAQFTSKLDQQIKFPAAHFEIVAERMMAGDHQSAHFRPVACLQGGRGFDLPSDFCHDVPRAAEFDRVEQGTGVLELL